MRFSFIGDREENANNDAYFGDGAALRDATTGLLDGAALRDATTGLLDGAGVGLASLSVEGV